MEAWVGIGTSVLEDVGVPIDNIAPELAPEPWAGEGVSDRLFRGEIDVSTAISTDVEREIDRFETAIFTDGAQKKGRSACGAAQYDGPSRSFERAGGGDCGVGKGPGSAEKEGIRLGVKMAGDKGVSPGERAVIFTDSLDSLKLLQSGVAKSPVDIALLQDVAESRVPISFKHVKSHSNIPGNEAANAIARHFTKHPHSPIVSSPPPVQQSSLVDIKELLREWLENERVFALQRLSETSNTASNLIRVAGTTRNPSLKGGDFCPMNRREEIVYNRLRVDAWCILVEAKPTGISTNALARTPCAWCGQCGDTRHFLEKCPCLAAERTLLDFDCCGGILQDGYQIAPFTSAIVDKLIQ